MNSIFAIDARSVCAALCIYNCVKRVILDWISELQFKENLDYAVDGGDVIYLTSSAAQKIYMMYLGKVER